MLTVMVTRTVMVTLTHVISHGGWIYDIILSISQDIWYCDFQLFIAPFLQVTAPGPSDCPLNAKEHSWVLFTESLLSLEVPDASSASTLCGCTYAGEAAQEGAFKREH